MSLIQLVSVSNHISSEITSTNGEQNIAVEERLYCLLRAICEANDAIGRWQAKKNILINALIDVEAKQSAYNEILTLKNKDAEIALALEALQRCQGVVDANKVIFEDVTSTLFAAFQVFKFEKNQEIAAIVQDLIKLEVPTSSFDMCQLFLAITFSQHMWSLGSCEHSSKQEIRHATRS